MKRKNKKKLNSVIWNIVITCIYLFIYIPVFVTIIFSFNDNRYNVSWSGFTLKWYPKLMHDIELWSILGTTLVIAITTTVLSVVIGTLGAYGLSKARFRGKGIVSLALYFPIVVPEIVIAVSTFMAFNLAGMKLSILTMILGNTTMVMPYVFVTVKSRLIGMDGSLEEASMDLGATRRYTFVNIVLPVIMPSVISGAFMSFTLSLNDLIVSSFLANASINTIPIRVYSTLKRGLSPEINALTSMILVIFTGIIFLYSVFIKKKSESIK